MEYEIFLNKVRKNLEKTDNYFECEMNEIIDVIRNTLTNEKIINISDLDVIFYKVKCYINRMIKKEELFYKIWQNTTNRSISLARLIEMCYIYIVSKILTIKPFYFDLHTLHLTSSSVCSESSSLKPLVQGFVFFRKYIKL